MCALRNRAKIVLNYVKIAITSHRISGRNNDAKQATSKQFLQICRNSRIILFVLFHFRLIYFVVNIIQMTKLAERKTNKWAEFKIAP